MRYNTLLLDVGDTLLDFQQIEANALSALFAEQGTTLTPKIKTSYKALNHHLWREFEEGRLSREGVTDNRFGLLSQQFGKTVDSRQMEKCCRHYLNQGHDLTPGSLELLKKVHPHAEPYIATNGMSHTQYQRLTDIGMFDYFKDIFVLEAVGAQKPTKEFFDHVSSRTPDLDKKQTVIIGDSPTSDIKGGGMAGIDTIWFNKDKLPKIEEIQPIYRIDSLEELYSLLEIEKDQFSEKYSTFVFSRYNRLE